VSADSRLLNSALAMGSQGVFPSRAMGGLGFHEQRYGHVSLMGKTYCVMYGLGANNAFDSYLLPPARCCRARGCAPLPGRARSWAAARALGRRGAHARERARQAHAHGHWRRRR
jgi:hypothetical protein